MKKAFVFPGQGAQFVGMGKDLYENSPEAKELFEKANEILGFRITDLMFNGTDEDLKQTKVTQPAIFLHSVILANSLTETPDMVAGNYNCPGQIVISGSNKGIETACQKLTEAGAKRVLPLKVGGAFHSPLMEPARQELETAIKNTRFSTPVCPIYQNVDAQPYTDPAKIQENLIAQLTASVRWTQIMKNMIADGATSFLEIGPGKVLQGLLKKVSTEIETNGIQ